MRKTMNISVSDDMLALIHEGVEKGSYGSVSEYIRSLIRRDQRGRNKIIAEVRPVNDCFITLEHAKEIVEMYEGRVS